MIVAQLVLMLQIMGALPGFTQQPFNVFLKIPGAPVAVQLHVFLIAGNKVLAVANRDVGQAAYDNCMKTGTNLACDPIRITAMRADADKRLDFAFALIATGYAWEKAFEDTQLILLPFL